MAMLEKGGNAFRDYSLPEAILKSYNRAATIHWDGKYNRRDIGQDILKLMQE